MKTVIEFLENKGWGFCKDDNELWKEDYISELRYKDLFELLEEYAQYVSKEPKDDIEKRRDKFAYLAIDINYDNNILTTLEVLNTNGTSFIEYWTERGENDRKMRFEKQTSFYIKRRLLTWRNNNYNNAKPTYTDKLGEYLNR